MLPSREKNDLPSFADLPSSLFPLPSALFILLSPVPQGRPDTQAASAEK